MPFVRLDVGGCRYTTSLDTLRSRPDSMLGTMFKESGVVAECDEEGVYMIDRDGESFRYILAYLRQPKGAAVVLPEQGPQRDMLANEADYYLLDELAAMCRAPLEYSILFGEWDSKRAPRTLKAINDKMVAGWRPTGGMSFHENGEGCQAFTRERPGAATVQAEPVREVRGSLHRPAITQGQIHVENHRVEAEAYVVSSEEE